MKLVVNNKLSSYDIIIKEGLIENIGLHIKDNLGDKLINARKFFVITDGEVESLYYDIVEKSLKHLGCYVEKYVINKDRNMCNEEMKNISTVMEIYSELAKFGIKRSDVIISLGGGVVGDISGFIASTYLRGIDYIQVPTTLLSQVDSSIGGKTGIDIDYGKNLVGSFYNPILVLIDPMVLDTLNKRELSASMAEVMKYAFIKNENLIKKIRILSKYIYDNHAKDKKYELLKDIIYECCHIKKEIVELDQFDKGERMILNFGHTIGHALETRYNYKKYLHGEAVAIGMYAITKKFIDKGYIKDDSILSEMKSLFELYDLDYTHECNENELYEFIKRDKKNIGNKIRVVVVTEMEKAEIIDVCSDDIISIGE